MKHQKVIYTYKHTHSTQRDKCERFEIATWTMSGILVQKQTSCEITNYLFLKKETINFLFQFLSLRLLHAHKV